ncbi:MAG: hypothetical protein R3A46_14895 [Thermomicrobiales bacterium]
MTVSVEYLQPGEVEPPHLENATLPYLAIPVDRDREHDSGGGLALVAVEGRDRKMAEALAETLDPLAVGIGLMHVTWLPRVISSPLESGGLNNPEPADLLAYEGAREALFDTAQELRQARFEVSTHLREDRDPAVPLAKAIREQHPNLFVLGLGRHGSGIGRRVLEEVRIPVLFVRAR